MSLGQAVLLDGRPLTAPPPPTKLRSRFPELGGLGLGRGEASVGAENSGSYRHAHCAPPSLLPTLEALGKYCHPRWPAPLPQSPAPWQGGAAQAGHPILHLITQAEPVTSSREGFIR